MRVCGALLLLAAVATAQKLLACNTGFRGRNSLRLFDWGTPGSAREWGGRHTHGCRDVAVDYAGKRVYWTDAELYGSAVRSADLDGRNARVFVAPPQPQNVRESLYTTLQVDASNRWLYFFNDLSDTVQRVSLDGDGNVTTVATMYSPRMTNSLFPTPFAVLPAENALLWMAEPLAEPRESLLMRCSLPAADAAGAELCSFNTSTIVARISPAITDGSGWSFLTIDTQSEPAVVYFARGSPSTSTSKLFSAAVDAQNVTAAVVQSITLSDSPGLDPNINAAYFYDGYIYFTCSLCDAAVYRVAADRPTAPPQPHARSGPASKPLYLLNGIAACPDCLVVDVDGGSGDNKPPAQTSAAPLSTGAILGIVAACLLVLAGAYDCYRRRNGSSRPLRGSSLIADDDGPTHIALTEPPSSA